MTKCNRISRERVQLADLDDTDDFHAYDNRAKVRRFTRAIEQGADIPPVFAIRLGGELTLIDGGEQIVAAERAGLSEIEAVVFDALDDAESDAVGAVGSALADAGLDIWAALRRAYGANCSVSLLPGMTAANRAAVVARLRGASIEAASV